MSDAITRAELVKLVKPLEWEETPRGGWKRGKVTGYIGGSQSVAHIFRTDIGWMSFGEVFLQGELGLDGALNAAKAAAREDHTNRVLSAFDLGDG